MHAQLRGSVTAFFLLAPATLAFTALPSTVLAQPASSPDVFSLQVANDGGLDPGARLQFTLRGTPNAQASVRIRGVREPIALNEVSRGIYSGRYIVKQSDRIDQNSPIRATLRQGDVTVAANYYFPPGIGNVALAPVPSQTLRIDRFNLDTQERIEPGAELRFSVDGMSGAVASVDLPGIVSGIGLRETRPGHYVGSYTVKRSDNLNMSGPPVATLRADNRLVTSSMAYAPMAGPADVPIQILSHANYGQVNRGVTNVRGRTAPFASVDIRVDAAPPVIGQLAVARQVFAQRLQADAEGNFEFSFSSPFPVPGTRYDIAVVASKADVTNEARLVLYQGQG